MLGDEREPANDAPCPRPADTRFVVGLVVLAYVVLAVDRQILRLLVTPTRRDLGISGRQMAWRPAR